MSMAIRHLLSVFLLASVTAPSCVLAAEEITGDWEIKMVTNGRETYGALTITRNADGSLKGKWGTADLSDVKFVGDKLSFVRTIRMGDQEFKMTYEGSLKDGSLSGTLSSDRGQFAANGARRKPLCPALGRWELKYTMRDREVSATLALSATPTGALEGKWTSGTGEHVISSVKFQDGKISFVRKSKFGEREMESTYEGTIQGNKLTGVFKSQRGEVVANGERAGGNLIGNWELTSTTDRGPRTSTLTVFGDLTGRYELFGGEVPIREIRIEGDQVTFSVEMGFGDQSFKLDFKGKVDGTTLKGEVTSQRGTREVTGKKIDSASALVGTWEITRESTQGQRTSKLTIKEDMTGTYTVQDNTVNITDLRLEGDQVTFKVTVKYGEREVPMEFKGKLDGTNLLGSFTSARGTREAKGRKVGTSI